jgi:dihydroorotase
MQNSLLLRAGRVIDPAQDIDRVADVAIVDGRIDAIGENLPPPPGATVLDVRDKIVSPGFFDIHVHAYGGLAFADPDSVGINLGSTSIVDAAGAGPLTWDEAQALLAGRTKTDIYYWISMRPVGIYGFEGIGEGSSARDIIDVAGNRLLDIVEANRERVVGLKLGAFTKLGVGPLKITKGMANVLQVPMYVHIGDIMASPPPGCYIDQVLDFLEPGDVVTHCFTRYHANLLGPDGKVLPQALAARDRGVQFDVGFGSFNFSFDVAERLLEQGLIPSIISTDLQQANVTGPVYSLPHVMSALMAVGMSLHDVVRRVTIEPARHLGLADKIGSLQPGMPADVTVCEIQAGEFVFDDTANDTRRGKYLLVPALAIKGGEVFYPDFEAPQDENNWSLEASIAYEEVPRLAERLDAQQRAFLRLLAGTLRDLDRWEGLAIHHAFHGLQKRTGIDLGLALEAVIGSFLVSRFTPAVGFFLASLDRDLVLDRLSAVAQLSGHTASQPTVPT